MHADAEVREEIRSLLVVPFLHFHADLLAFIACDWQVDHCVRHLDSVRARDRAHAAHSGLTSGAARELAAWFASAAVLLDGGRPPVTGGTTDALSHGLDALAEHLLTVPAPAHELAWGVIARV